MDKRIERLGTETSIKKIKTFKLRSFILILSCIALIGGTYVKFDNLSPASNKIIENLSGSLSINNKIDKSKYLIIKKDKIDIHKGNLILVNSNIINKTIDESSLISVFDGKNDSYKVNDRNTSVHKEVINPLNNMFKEFEKEKNCDDVIINSGYRSYEEQKNVYEEKIKEVGKSQVSKWAALPGESEHHTGYALDFGIYTDLGISRGFKGSGKYKWINENAYKYGFIVRYAEEKSKLTGINHEPWHFRYVGVPHAYAICKNDFCLEEYINYLKEFNFGEKHLNVTDFQGQKYEIYFVKSQGRTTNVPVPNGHEYSISGNNEDGFIVTYKLSS